MALTTSFSIPPYFDDWDVSKQYYRILFKPGVAVQARELNQIQSILQGQIEKFGDNIFKQGTIIEGCDVTFHANFPYVKIRDNETDGRPVNVGAYLGKRVRNAANIVPLEASITTAVSGFESRNPDLNTLYVRYINSGVANVSGEPTEVTTFAPGETLTVYDPNDVVESINIVTPSAGFSNSDAVVLTSAVLVQNSTGGTGFSNEIFLGDHVVNGTGANVQVIGISHNAFPGAVLLQLKPRPTDLKSGTPDNWTIRVGDSLQSTNSSPSDIVSVVDVLGTGAAATLRTGSLGQLVIISMTSKGAGYKVPPTVTIQSPGATVGQITAANLQATTIYANVAIANAATAPIGTGYAVTVGEGTIYQKGYFTLVREHLVIVDKYNNLPDDVVAGFATEERVVTFLEDPTLLDNALGEPNFTAPGADRVRLAPFLKVTSRADASANSDFLPIIEWSAGVPYKQTRRTAYSIIGDEMARRTKEESGDYVIDPFQLNSFSANISNEPTVFRVLIDPGVAYINGRRVATVGNFQTSVRKGIDTSQAATSLSLNYGSFVRVNNLGGDFNPTVGSLVTLYPNSRAYITSSERGTAPTTTGLGTPLGTARVRAIVHESGKPGTFSAVYRVYLFDIRLAIAANFQLVRAIYHDGASTKGVADVIEAVLQDPTFSSLIFPAGQRAIKQTANVTYTLRATSNHTLSANGVITMTAAAPASFPYSGALSATQRRDVIVVPLANARSDANIAGSVTITSGSDVVTGTGTNFIANLSVGDFIRVGSSDAQTVQVRSITNATHFLAQVNATATATGNATMFFPAFVPIHYESGTRSMNASATGDELRLQLGFAVNAATAVRVTYNLREANVSPVAKTVNRGLLVRIRPATHPAGTRGPWTLGIPDAFRLRSVWLDTNDTFAVGTGTNVTSEFYIDGGHEKDYYDLSRLVLKPESTLTFDANDRILVEFDAFTHSSSGGLKAPGASGTYLINDAAALNALATAINTMEIPEATIQGEYFDLRDCFDFRPCAVNTAAYATTATAATINPPAASATTRFDAADKKFPAPDAPLTASTEFYRGRVDRVVVTENNSFHFIAGVPGSTEPPPHPDGAITINLLAIPPYPSLPFVLSDEMTEIVDTKMISDSASSVRFRASQIRTPVDRQQRQILQPRGFTMSDIARIERRVADLEYYTSFTMLEVLAQRRSIPSRVSPSIDRFKFGFFVDSFDDQRYSDVAAPGYAAAIVNGMLAPPVKETSVRCVATQIPIAPFLPAAVVRQDAATDGPIVQEPAPAAPDDAAAGPESPSGSALDPFTGTIVVSPPPPTTSPDAARTTQVQAVIRQTHRTTASSSNPPYVYEDFFYVFSERPGAAEMFLNSRDNLVAAEISASSSAAGPWTVVATSASAAAITRNDIRQRGLDSPPLNRTKIEHPGTLVRVSFGPVGNFIEDQFKLSWTHTPSARGQFYRVRIFKGGRQTGPFRINQGRRGTFEFKLFFPQDVVEQRSATPRTTNFNFNFAGMLTFDRELNVRQNLQYPVSLDYGGFNLASIGSDFVFSYEPVRVTVTGLRPNTTHAFFADGVLSPAAAAPVGGRPGDPLVSNEEGVIIFDFTPRAPTSAPASDISAGMSVLRSLAGKIEIRVVSSDGASSAVGTVPLPTYVENNISAPPPPTQPLRDPGGGRESIEFGPSLFVNFQ